MAKIEILMPNMGESIFECTVLKWLVKEGDFVRIDDMIIEVATDKIDTEIGSSHEGVITQLLVKEGDVANIGSAICVLDSSYDQINAEVDSNEKEVIETAAIINSQITQVSELYVSNAGPRFLSPLVINIAKQENISQAELDALKGTGLNERITKDDLYAYIKSRKVGSVSIKSATVSSTPIIINENDQVVEMDRMRKMISERMVESRRISAHVSSFIETDMSKVVQWRETEKENFRKKNGHGGLTFTPILVDAVIKAIQKYPGINIQVSNETIVYKGDINIGIAVALPNGNLIVPVVHNADKLSLNDLANKINDLASRARANQLKPEELQGGTYTISNIGSFGNISGTPIILQPQVAIMAFGVIRKMPAVIETADGDVIAIRQKMIISHSYDHRVIDGSLGGLFLKEVSDNLEKFDLKRSI